MDRRTCLIVGLVIFLAGGAVLAFMSGRTGTVIGTTAGLLGLGLMVWGFVQREE